MKQIKYYCDLCKEENTKYDEKKYEFSQHGKELEDLTNYLITLNYLHTHKDCVLKKKKEIDNILPEQKK